MSDSLGLCTWSSALARISELVPLEETARQFKAFLRARGVKSTADLLRLALMYAGGSSLRGSSAWAQASAIADLSGPALLKRLGKAADWLGFIARRLLVETRPQIGGAWAGWRLRVIDASTICQPGADRTTWRLHVSYDLSGGVDDFELTDDKGAERLTRFTWQPGDLGLADRGYARPGDFAPVLDSGAHLVVRTGWNSLRLLTPGGEPFDLFAALDSLKGESASHQIVVDTHDPARPHLPLRLIVGRLPPDKAEIARKKVMARAIKAGKRVDPRSLQAAGYVLLLTSLPDEHTAEAILQLYRLRWQIELLFKRFKSLLGLGDLPAKQRNLARSWIFGKLILALLVERTARELADSSPCAPAHAAFG
jgi:Transposase DDE domain